MLLALIVFLVPGLGLRQLSYYSSFADGGGSPLIRNVIRAICAERNDFTVIQRKLQRFCKTYISEIAILYLNVSKGNQLQSAA